jgi:hypothetical protein
MTLYRGWLRSGIGTLPRGALEDAGIKFGEYNRATGYFHIETDETGLDNLKLFCRQVHWQVHEVENENNSAR